MTIRKHALILTLTTLFCLLLGTLSLASTLDVVFDEVEFAQIFRVLGESEGYNVLVDPSVLGKGSFQLKDVVFNEALDLISKHSGYGYQLIGNTLFIASNQRLAELEGKDVRYVAFNHLSSSEVAEALALVLPRSSVYVHPLGGLVVLQGSKKDLDRAEELLLVLDRPQVQVPLANVEQTRSVLDVFQDLSAELNLNLVADPALEAMRLYVSLRNENPEAVIRQIQQLLPIRVELTESSLLVGTLSADSSAERIKVYRLNYAEPEAAFDALTAFVPEAQLRVDTDRKSVIVRGTDLVLAEVDLFLIDFDQPLPQVVLEVWVQEMSTEAMQNLGVEWRGLPSFSGGTAPSFFELQWEPWELILALRALEDLGEAKLLANPKITTMSGKEARIFVGDRVPVVLKQEDGSQQIQFIESGINLKVTPRISDDEYITILVKPEVSTFIWRSDTEYPQIRTREAETIVRVKNGQPIVLGGLLQEQENEMISRIPFLSQLPVLGKLFQWKETKKTQTEMTIFLIPRIVDGEHGVVDQSFFTPAQ